MPRRPVGTPELMKKLNRESVLFLVESQGPISQADIARTLKMSRATVSTIVRELVNEGILCQVGKGNSFQGRRPTLLELNPRAAVVVAIDLSQPLPTAAMVDLGGAIISRRVGADLRRIHGKAALNEFLKFVQDVVREETPLQEKVRGVGIAVPGITSSKPGVVRSSAGLGWYDVELAKAVSDVTGLPAQVDNDVNLAALGEMWRGAARGVRNLVMVHVGDGIGAAVVIEGRIYRGIDDAAGEIGHMILSEADLGGNYTEWGWLEVHASEHFLAKRLARGQFSSAEGPDGKLDDPAASPDNDYALRDAAKWVGMAVCNIIACLNPELCLLSGGLVAGGWVSKEDIRRWVGLTVPSVPRIELGSLGQDASLIGAAAQVFQLQGLIEI